MSKLILNTKSNANYEVVATFFPEIVLSLHNQSPYLKRYSFFILSQIFWTKSNREKNILMSINFLQKDSNSSDSLVRANAIKMLTDMSGSLNDIFPFLLETINSGIAD